MAAKWVRSGVLDNGLNDIKNSSLRMCLISAYAPGDLIATVIANTIASVAMVAADFVLSSSGNDRLLTVAEGKTATATVTVAGTPDLHIAFIDGATLGGALNVIWVTDETTNQPITINNIINFPAPVYTSKQPT